EPRRGPDGAADARAERAPARRGPGQARPQDAEDRLEPADRGESACEDQHDRLLLREPRPRGVPVGAGAGERRQLRGHGQAVTSGTSLTTAYSRRRSPAPPRSCSATPRWPGTVPAGRSPPARPAAPLGCSPRSSPGSWAARGTTGGWGP